MTHADDFLEPVLLSDASPSDASPSNVLPFDVSPARRTRTRWSFERVARLGFLVGQGHDAKRVARDPMIASTSTNVHRQAQRFGLAFREAGGLRLPNDIAGRYAAAAAKRGLSPDGLIREILVAAGSEDTLIDNILDDGH